MTPIQETDLLLDSLSSATPPSLPNDWELENLLVAWRQWAESEPMREWVAA